MGNIQVELPGAVNPGDSRGYIRQLTSREGTRIIDAGGNRDATILAPVSKFNGESSKCIGIPTFEFLDNYIELSFRVDKDSDKWKYNVLLGGKLLLIRNNELVYYILDSSETWTRCTTPIVYGEIYHLRVNFRATEVEFILNGVSSIVSITSYRIPHAELTIGSHNNWAFEGDIWDLNFGGLRVPLPHLGYGFDIDNNLVELTNTNVGANYIKEGSTWLLDKGCIKREPELSVNGDFSNGLSEWSAVGSGVPILSIDNKVVTVANSRVGSAILVQNTILPIGKYICTFEITDMNEFDSIGVGVSSSTGSFSLETVKIGVNSIIFDVTSEAQLLAIGQKGTLPATAYFSIKNISLKPYHLIIPNKPDGTLALPLEPGDTFIPGDAFLNCSPYKIDFTGGASGSILDEESYQVFNKANTDIWK